MKIVAFSDTHGQHKNLTIPDGDVLIHAGDFSMRATLKDVVAFAQWFKALPHEHKIIIPGNHDVYCQHNMEWTKEEFYPAIVLDHDWCEVMGHRLFGSPFSSSIFEPSPWAFDYPRGGPLSKRLWSTIPSDTNILITHGPPKGIGDRVENPHRGEDPHVGDEFLRQEVFTRVHPVIHIFGHIHEGYGTYPYAYNVLEGYGRNNVRECTTTFYNVCVCDSRYRAIHPITVIEYPVN